MQKRALQFKGGFEIKNLRRFWKNSLRIYFSFFLPISNHVKVDCIIVCKVSRLLQYFLLVGPSFCLLFIYTIFLSARWQIDSKRNINYRSFEPIIRLLPVSHTPECQLWAVWAIANLTKVSLLTQNCSLCNLINVNGTLCYHVIFQSGCRVLTLIMLSWRIRDVVQLQKCPFLSDLVSLKTLEPEYI